MDKAFAPTAFDGVVDMEFETVEDAMRECIRALGGSKSAGYLLFPEKGVDGAARHLLACLEPSRAERLSPSHLLHLFRLARDRGCHAGMQYVSKHLGYSMPSPVEPADEIAEIQRRYELLLEKQRHLNEQMQRAADRIFEANTRPGPRPVRSVG